MQLSHVGHSPRSWSAHIPGPVSHGLRATPRGHWFSGTSGLPCGGHGGLGSQRRPSGTKDIRPACLEVARAEKIRVGSRGNGHKGYHWV